MAPRVLCFQTEREPPTRMRPCVWVTDVGAARGADSIRVPVESLPPTPDRHTPALTFVCLRNDGREAVFKPVHPGFGHTMLFGLQCVVRGNNTRESVLRTLEGLRFFTESGAGFGMASVPLADDLRAMTKFQAYANAEAHTRAFEVDAPDPPKWDPCPLDDIAADLSGDGLDAFQDLEQSPFKKVRLSPSLDDDLADGCPPFPFLTPSPLSFRATNGLWDDAPALPRSSSLPEKPATPVRVFDGAVYVDVPKVSATDADTVLLPMFPFGSPVTGLAPERICVSRLDGESLHGFPAQLGLLTHMEFVPTQALRLHLPEFRDQVGVGAPLYHVCQLPCLSSVGPEEGRVQGYAFDRAPGQPISAVWCPEFQNGAAQAVTVRTTVKHGGGEDTRVFVAAVDPATGVADFSRDGACDGDVFRRWFVDRLAIPFTGAVDISLSVTWTHACTRDRAHTLQLFAVQHNNVRSVFSPYWFTIQGCERSW